jgi:hypothetical protein
VPGRASAVPCRATHLAIYRHRRQITDLSVNSIVVLMLPYLTKDVKS